MNPDWIAPARTALLLVDCQVDFGAPDGEMARRGMDMTAPRAALAQAGRLLDAARSGGVMPVFARLVTRRGAGSAAMQEEKRRKGDSDEAGLCVAGSHGAAFTGVTPRGGEWVVDKARYSAFAGTGLAARLKAAGIDTLVLAGLTSECCVASSAWSAFEDDFHVFLAEDACAAYDSHLHRESIKALTLSGAVALTSAQVAAIWNKP
jgi:nicotinamidase-related amidase